ncbi:hypothetical protein ARMGADRAFT_598820 [Armillaria gallica]|uniref:Uncharacterized protein n=1 Tax=Armillaria gallica TaxID=47427 RepID=A0A2H3D1F7_ARMGA|nr:hypothetical protein ARMGADRAFT_598820 [Armillaria gallica]
MPWLSSKSSSADLGLQASHILCLNWAQSKPSSCRVLARTRRHDWPNTASTTSIAEGGVSSPLGLLQPWDDNEKEQGWSYNPVVYRCWISMQWLLSRRHDIISCATRMEPDICMSIERIFEGYESYTVEHKMEMKVEGSCESITLLQTL